MTVLCIDSRSPTVARCNVFVQSTFPRKQARNTAFAILKQMKSHSKSNLLLKSKFSIPFAFFYSERASQKHPHPCLNERESRPSRKTEFSTEIHWSLVGIPRGRFPRKHKTVKTCGKMGLPDVPGRRKALDRASSPMQIPSVWLVVWRAFAVLVVQ